MPLEHGQKIGQHRIIEYIGESVFGAAYSVVFGSTNRKYALHTIPRDTGVTVESLEEYIRKIRKLQSPCIIKCFAAGETDDFLWIRTERPCGLKQINLFTDISCQTDEEKTKKCVFDLDSLIAESATTGGLAGDDASLVLEDILETISNLHAYNMYAGSKFSNPLLDKLMNPVGVVARVPIVMWPDVVDIDNVIKADVVEAGKLIEKVANAVNIEEKAWSKAKAALLQLADKAQRLDGYVAACQLYVDMLEVFSSAGIKYYGRCSVDEFIVKAVVPKDEEANEEDASQEEALPEKSSHGHKVHSSKHKHKSAFSKQRRRGNKPKVDTVNQQIMRNSKFILLLLLICGFCGGLAYFLHKREQEALLDLSINGESAYSAISIIGEEEQLNEEEMLPRLVENYSVEQLINYKASKPLAAARYSIILWFGLDGVSQNREEAAALIEKNKSYFDEQCKYDQEVEFWRAYLLLTGIGYEPQRVEAEGILDKLANNGLAKASLMLGDLYAQRTTGVKADNDARAMEYWRLATRAEYGYNENNVQAMNRILYFVSENRGMPREKDYPLLFNAIERFASVDHIPSQYVLATLNYEGKYIPRDYSNAVKWYRRLANNTRVPFVIRADAMVKLGTMFLKGEANQSNDAAYHWYERAAELGDAIAMQHLEELYLKEVPREFANEEEKIKAGDANYWKNKRKGADIIEIKGMSEPSYTIFTDQQMKSFKQAKPMPITIRIQYAGTRENSRTTEAKEIFKSVKVVKQKKSVKK